jgi:replicative DNA helicase
VLDAPAGIPAVWGRADEVLWSRGEGLLIVGPPGVGKTTLAGQLVWARLGLLDRVLGYDVQPTESRVLYLAMDRPRQVQRAFARLATEDQRGVLDERLVVRPGPPPRDLAKHPQVLTELAKLAGADTVVLDSLKDAALGLSDDEVGAGLNRAQQTALAEGIEVVGLHHQRKSQNGSKPTKLEDVFGSTWITAGAGSVVLLWGQAGDSLVELSHLKQPGSVVGPLAVEHDHDRGLSSVQRGFDPLAWLRSGGGTAQEAGEVRHGTSPTDNQLRAVRKQLDKLVAKGLAHKIEAVKGGPTGTQPARWYPLKARFGEAARPTDPSNGPPRPSRTNGPPTDTNGPPAQTRRSAHRSNQRTATDHKTNGPDLPP